MDSTYEGLKPWYRPVDSYPHPSLDSTYEGLKLLPPDAIAGAREGLDSTYEGLKLVFELQDVDQLRSFGQYL